MRPAASSDAAPAAGTAPATPAPLHSPRDRRFLDSALLYALLLASLLYFVLLPERPLISQGVYIDENAIMAMGAYTGVQMQGDKYVHETIKQYESGARLAGPHAREWVRSTLQSMSLSVSEFRHDHTSSPMVSAAPFGNRSVESVILQGIWRAPKSDGKECIVIVAEYDASFLAASASMPAPGSGEGAVPFSGLSILLTVTHILAQRGGHEFQARDLILLAVERHSPTALGRSLASEAVGAWLASYKSASSSMQRAGSIFTMLVLDIPFFAPSAKVAAATGGLNEYDSLSLDVVGHYGLLPNLDLPSMAFRIAENFALDLVVAESAVRQDAATATAIAGSASHSGSSALSQLDATVTSSFAGIAPAFLRPSFYSVSTPNESPRVIDLDPWQLVNRAVLSLLGKMPFDSRWHLWDTNLARWKGLWRFMISMCSAGGDQQGMHVHATQWGIDAITLRAIPKTAAACKTPPTPAVRLQTATRVAHTLDSLLRAHNNLIEKLHHSTWWYLLNHRADFVTMSKYIYMAVGPLAIMALHSLGLLAAAILPTSGSAAVPTSNRFAQSAKIVAAIYALVAAMYFSVGFFIAVVGGGKWNEVAMRAWGACCVGCIAMFFAVVLPALTRLRSDSEEGVQPMIVALLPRKIAEDQAKDEAMDLANAATTAAASNKETASDPASPVPPQLGLELPLSPPGLPLLVPSLLSTPAPRFFASLDWRTFHALLLACILATLVPVMVLNTSACVLSLVAILPLVMCSRADMWPSRWASAFAAMKDKQGRALRFSERDAAWVMKLRYLARLAAHLAALVFASPPVLLLLYSHWHSLSLSQGLHAVVHDLARTPGNLLYITFFFAYLPAFVGSIVLATTTFKIREGAHDAHAKKTQ